MLCKPIDWSQAGHGFDLAGDHLTPDKKDVPLPLTLQDVRIFQLSEFVSLCLTLSNLLGVF